MRLLGVVGSSDRLSFLFFLACPRARMSEAEEVAAAVALSRLGRRRPRHAWPATSEPTSVRTMGRREAEEEERAEEGGEEEEPADTDRRWTGDGADSLRSEVAAVADFTSLR